MFKSLTLTFGLMAFALFMLHGLWTVIGPILSMIQPVPTF